MSNSFKRLLLSIASLPFSDQHWILNRLSAEHLSRFEHQEGMKYLQQARRFRRIRSQLEDHSPIVNESLPDDCYELSKQSPLYIAIILEEGRFPWGNEFLKQFDRNGSIHSLMMHPVKRIKPRVKQAIFQDWEEGLSFDSYLRSEEPI